MAIEAVDVVVDQDNGFVPLFISFWISWAQICLIQRKTFYFSESLIINTVWLKAWLECGGGGKWPLQSLTTDQPCSRSILCCCIFLVQFCVAAYFFWFRWLHVSVIMRGNADRLPLTQVIRFDFHPESILHFLPVFIKINFCWIARWRVFIGVAILVFRFVSTFILTFVCMF